MKKFKLIFFVSLLFCLFSCSSAFAADYTIEVNGQKLDTEVKIVDGRSLIPLRAVGEALGLDVTWNGDSQAVLLDASDLLSHEKNSDIMLLDCKNNNYIAAVDGNEKYISLENGKYRFNTLALIDEDAPLCMYVPPVNIDGHLYVPVKLICYTFGSPLEINGDIISIGSCFTDSSNTSEKIANVIDMEKKVDGTARGKLLYMYDASSTSTLQPSTGTAEIDTDGAKAIWKLLISVTEKMGSATQELSDAVFLLDSKIKPTDADIKQFVQSCKYHQKQLLSAKEDYIKAKNICVKYKETQKLATLIDNAINNLNGVPTETVTLYNCTDYLQKALPIVDKDLQLQDTFTPELDKLLQILEDNYE